MLRLRLCMCTLPFWRLRIYHPVLLQKPAKPPSALVRALVLVLLPLLTRGIMDLYPLRLSQIVPLYRLPPMSPPQGAAVAALRPRYRRPPSLRRITSPARS